MLRGINVGGQKRVSMQVLKEIYSSLGYREVQTYVQSGNVIFSAEASGSSVKEELEKEIKRTFSFDVLVFLRNKSELAALVKNSPFKQKDETKSARDLPLGETRKNSR